MTALHPEKREALRKLAIAELWRRRAFWPLLEHYLDRDQLTDIRSLFEGVNPEKGELPKSGWWDEISRQRGKSYKWTTLAVVWCHCFPGQRVKYLAQLGTSVRGIIAPTIDALIDDMPAQMRPSWRPQKGVLEWTDPNLGQIRIDRQDHKWHFPHPGGRESVIHAAGANNQHYRALRGEPAHWQIEDECAFYDDFDEVQAVLGPMLLTTGGVTVFATTPAESPEHPSKKVRDAHEADGRYVHRTLYNHPRMSDTQIADFLLKEAKKRGMDLPTFRRSTYYRRELLCMWVAEETRAIVPEWSAVADEDKPEAGTYGATLCYEHNEFPEFFAMCDALDIGFTKDPSGYIWGYWNFKEARLYIHAELPFQRQKRTDELAAAIKGLRERWAPTSRPPPHVDAVRHSSGGHWLPYLSVGDAGGNGAEKLAELAKHHDIHFVHAEKTDLESMVDELGVFIRQGKLRVHKKNCPNLVSQLANGLWAAKGKIDFEHTAHHHNDHLIALVYLVRMLAGLRAFNPYPPFHGKDPANMIIPERRDSTGIQAVKSVLE